MEGARCERKLKDLKMFWELEAAMKEKQNSKLTSDRQKQAVRAVTCLRRRLPGAGVTLVEQTD